jgi:hypothetical protein
MSHYTGCHISSTERKNLGSVVLALTHQICQVDQSTVVHDDLSLSLSSGNYIAKDPNCWDKQHLIFMREHFDYPRETASVQSTLNALFGAIRKSTQNPGAG